MKNLSTNTRLSPSSAEEQSTRGGKNTILVEKKGKEGTDNATARATKVCHVSSEVLGKYRCTLPRTDCKETRDKTRTAHSSFFSVVRVRGSYLVEVPDVLPVDPEDVLRVDSPDLGHLPGGVDHVAGVGVAPVGAVSHLGLAESVAQNVLKNPVIQKKIYKKA